jgi:hypothetical protein
MLNYYSELDESLRLFDKARDMETFKRFHQRWAQSMWLPPLPSSDEVLEIALHKLICSRVTLGDIAPGHQAWLARHELYPEMPLWARCRNGSR